MNRIPLFVLTTLMAISIPAAAQRHERERERRPANPPAPAPAPKGWPHSIASGSATGCARDPLPNEVIVFRDAGFAGDCAVLHEGFYPQADNFLIGNDTMTSLKVGSAVRARLFSDASFEGDWTLYPGGSAVAGLATWNDVVSSMRVEPASRSSICKDVQEGEIALFGGRNYSGDCVVLPADISYANTELMGIANDRIFSINNHSARTLTAFWTVSYHGFAAILPPHTVVPLLRGGISSIQMQ